MSEGDLGLVTEAETIEGLQREIEMMIPDLVDGDQSQPFEVGFTARESTTGDD